MISTFQFSSLPRTYFGVGSIGQLPLILESYSGAILIVTGGASFSHSGLKPRLEHLLRDCGKTFLLESITGEPSPQNVDALVEKYRDKGIAAIVAIGGGSVIDTGKAVSAMMHRNESVVEFLEGVGHIAPDGVKRPFIAIPTTAGTGSEATKNAPISQIGASGYKKSLRHERYIPDVALIDPELTVSCSPLVTASCGMDAFTQLLESFVSTHSSPLTDALAWQGLEMAAVALPKAVANGSDLSARTDMSYAAFLSGITLANAGLGLVHGIAGVLGGYFTIPHGIACATLLPAVTRSTLEYLRNNDPTSVALGKYAQVGALFSSLGAESLEDCQDALVEELEKWRKTFAIPSLSEFGVTLDVIEKIAKESSSKENPGVFTQEQKCRILQESL